MQPGAHQLARSALFLALLFCFVARGLVPAGWMPAFSATGTVLVPCSGTVTPPSPEPAAHSSHHSSPHDEEHKTKHDVGAQQCAFAAAAADLPPALGQARPSVLPDERRPRGAPHAVSTGQGLAAPPPPSTGPPLNA